MPYDLACPSCRSKLQIADGVHNAFLTCPRCLKAIQNPAWKEAVSVKMPATAPGAPAFSMTCPECGKPTQADSDRCSHCGATLREPREPSLLPSRGRRPWVENDVRRDTRGLSVGIILLAVLGGIGVVQTLAVAGAAALHGQREPVISVICSLGVLALMTAGFLLARHNPETIGVGRVVVSTLAFIGFLFLLLLALLIFLFAVCVAVVVGSGAMR